MSDEAPRTLLRKSKIVDWKIIVDIIMQQNIIDSDFTGDLSLSFNRGGVSGCKKIETIK